MLRVRRRAERDVVLARRRLAPQRRCDPRCKPPREVLLVRLCVLSRNLPVVVPARLERMRRVHRTTRCRWRGIVRGRGGSRGRRDRRDSERLLLLLRLLRLGRCVGCVRRRRGLVRRRRRRVSVPCPHRPFSRPSSTRLLLLRRRIRPVPHRRPRLLLPSLLLRVLSLSLTRLKTLRHPRRPSCRRRRGKGRSR